MKQTRYVVMRLSLWANMELNLPVPVGVNGQGIGFLPVYDSLEDLRKDYPDAKHAIIEPAEVNPGEVKE